MIGEQAKIILSDAGVTDLLLFADQPRHPDK